MRHGIRRAPAKPTRTARIKQQFAAIDVEIATPDAWTYSPRAGDPAGFAAAAADDQQTHSTPATGPV
jgi:hypothetical protein